MTLHSQEAKKEMEQRLEDMLETLKSNILAATPEDIAAFWEPARAAFDAYHSTMARFEEDLKKRQTVLDQQAQQLDKHIRELGTQIKSLETKGREAASRGDLDAAAQADEQAEALRQQAAAARRKRRIATSTELRGDPALYEAVEKARGEYSDAFSACQAAVREAVAVIAEWERHFQELHEQVRHEKDRGPADAGYTDKRWMKIDKNFRREVYQKIEAEAERVKREEREREEFKRRVFIYGG